MADRYPNVFSPLQIADVTIPNRIVRTAHGTGLAGEDLFAYHEARARGGVALSILQIAGAHPNSPTPTVPIRSAEMPRIYAELISRTRPYGMRLFQQISHAGSEVPSAPGLAQWSSSAVPGILVGTVPIAMTQTMIDDAVAGYADAARVVKESGIDGVEIHAAHGYLVHQFLSPALNHREDDYGGSAENRLRFLRQILAAVRSAVSSDFPVGIRLAGDDGIPDSLLPSEVSAIAHAVESDVDFIDLSLGSHWHFHKMLTSMESPLGYEIPVNEPIARSLQVPTIVTGRIMTLDHAEHLLETGVADMVSMVRATIADPHLVKKARAGRDSEIRPCTGTNQGCIGQFMTAGRIACAVNASAGREAIMPEPLEPATGRLLVIGGGLAGMEVARLGAERGYDVDLHEMRRELGGQSREASGAAARADFGVIADWLESELFRLGVSVHRGSVLDPQEIVALAPDVTVVATGSAPDREMATMMNPRGPVPGADRAHVLTTWDALRRNRGPLGPRIIVYDDTGAFDALTVALRLTEEGCAVTLVTRNAGMGAELPEPRATVVPALEILARTGVVTHAWYTLEEVTADGARFRSVLGATSLELEADHVVLSTYPRPDRDLPEALEDAGIPFTMVGDVTGTHDLLRTFLDASLTVRGW